MVVWPLPLPGPPMGFHAPNGRSTPFDVNCIKRKCSEGVGQLGELHVCEDPTLAQRVAELERVLAAAIAAEPPPPPPRPVGRPRLERSALAILLGKPVVWVQPLPLQLPSHQVHVSLRLLFSSRAADEKAKKNRTSSNGFGSGWR